MKIHYLPGLLCSLILLQGCFDRPDHAAADADQSKPSLQMHKSDVPAPDPQPGPEPKPQPNPDQDN
ncbi:hypothetical protein N5D52_23525 [Pseudomonas sp. GD03860]|uniref:hypothetical protein n=1 Tax=Pseudomonas TaxID=286 RepID=UPI002363D0DD|nr:MULTISPECIES: hypothetical protein [Pseudomonas]MDD2058959.1 hypothetical protein [Pseudomonas putida]MDH0639899.1 hypothetical protein [Pseudomonas sp. GD03860]